MSWVLLLLATMGTASGTAPSAALPVRLAAVSCPDLPDAEVRAALRVELRDRLVPEAAPAPPDFALVSVACVAEDVELLIVHQGSGGPVRRLVPLVQVAPDARPRVVAVAVAELLRVDAAFEQTPPAPTAAAPPPPEANVVTLVGTPFALGGYFAGSKRYWFVGYQLRLAFESATEPQPGRVWGWGVALGVDGIGPNPAGRFNLAGTVSALVRRQTGEITCELGLGLRFGHAWDDGAAASPKSANIFGPTGALAVEARVYRQGISRISFEAGHDSGPLGGTWARLVAAAGFRF